MVRLVLFVTVNFSRHLPFSRPSSDLSLASNAKTSFVQSPKCSFSVYLRLELYIPVQMSTPIISSGYWRILSTFFSSSSISFFNCVVLGPQTPASISIPNVGWDKYVMVASKARMRFFIDFSYFKKLIINIQFLTKSLSGIPTN